ncbi:hypothetical protein Gogos_021462 [Gossypium gossypioides]|uniref:UBN2 domain-containing protein n=1 Tax=Gossypium gossypioides TaxID=34282 RepID=A0A7J9D6E9_GOSGO|nr:hypothetical protein [Gossypium gossypioides]
MFGHFTHIINGFKAFGKIYPNKDMVKKMLNSLPMSWEAKVRAIEESKDLNSLSFDELISYLLTYQMRLNKGSEEERIMKKNVGKAFKSTINEDNESSEEVAESKEMEMFSRRLKKIHEVQQRKRILKEGMT